MAETRKAQTGAYQISNVRRGLGKDEYVMTLVRDGKPAGDVKIRATSSAPAYYDDLKARTVPKAG